MIIMITSPCISENKKTPDYLVEAIIYFSKLLNLKWKLLEPKLGETLLLPTIQHEIYHYLLLYENHNILQLQKSELSTKVDFLDSSYELLMNYFSGINIFDGFQNKQTYDYLIPRKQSQYWHLKTVFSSNTSYVIFEIFSSHFGHLTIYHTKYKHIQYLNKNIVFGGFN